jgi:hypothetical protein
MALKSCIKLNKYGYNSKLMDTSLKSSLYKCYVRPVLFYGIENIKLRQNEIKQIQTIESTLIKRSLGLSNRTRSTKLLYAFQLEPIHQRDKYLKLAIYILLMARAIN